MRVVVALGLLVALFSVGCVAPAAVTPAALEGVGAFACPGSALSTGCELGLDGPGVNEFAVAANPLDPDNAIIVGNDYQAQKDEQLRRVNRLWGSWWWTKDAGETWTKGTLPGMLPQTGSSLSGYQFVGDLVIAFGPDGRAWLAGIGYTVLVAAPSVALPGGGSVGGSVYRNVVFVTTSEDGGETFADPTLLDTRVSELIFHDKPAIAVDADGRVLIVWNFIDDKGQRGARTGGMRGLVTEDGGATWTASMLSKDDLGISASIAVGPDGAYNVLWRSYEPYAVRFARSTDHGKTWSAPVLARELAPMDLLLPGTSYRAFVLPALSSLPDGTLVGVTADEGDREDSDVFVLRSTDQGATWTSALLHPPSTAAQFLPTIAHDDGVLVAAWLDRGMDDDEAYRLTAATSTDGLAWTPLPVSSARSVDPNGPPTRGPLGIIIGSPSTFIGDYLGAALEGGRLYLAWPDLREDGRSHLYAAVLMQQTP